MKRQISILFLFVFISLATQAQEKYVGQIYADLVKSTHTYTDTLKLDFYTAKGNKTDETRPLILLVHGGGFSGGNRDNAMEVKFSQAMATKGYAVASMSYNLTRKGKATGFGCACPASEKMVTFKQTTADILKAIAYLKSNSEFSFDAEKIILAGSSAGAEGVLNTAYMANHPDFKNLGDYPKIAAVVSLAGAVVDARYITKNNAVPGFFIHGDADDLVPYASQPHHFCAFDTPGFLPLDGDAHIAAKLKNLDASYTLLTAPQGNHDWANLGYAFVHEIAFFLNAVVNQNELIQHEEDVEKK
ncbi:alpha/beta hydrolase [Leeuwenhoekiella marinoflava]|uniref:Acetyl esterase/lipase n=2 Tax=Leeuwenhoekiella marinoflava TaxID=988 RepID=A0A4Q0PPY4_9FLAO|nr:alpha/beta hydrolase [Leeuwenhoekiella marinoflava]RXG31885.1 acetyl esterase/lipase [Leeuwenhoekiella marinoflava]SHE90312.1 Acetyl esterase/lipase [Leeuwenhoekiella marinoflava DSM 3653]